MSINRSIYNMRDDTSHIATALGYEEKIEEQTKELQEKARKELPIIKKHFYEAFSNSDESKKMDDNEVWPPKDVMKLNSLINWIIKTLKNKQCTFI